MTMAIDEIASRSAAGIALAYRTGEAGPVAVTECLLDRIARASGDHIFITVTADRARAEAEKAEARYRRAAPASPIDGVPIGWKDLFDVAGAPTTAGSKVLGGGPIQTADAPCVANTAAAGAVCMGKLNMTEFAYSGVGLNPHYGTPLNPNDRKTPRSPGGSSSGSGAAVAARLLPAAIGTDTGGSVRIPAAFNGVVGYKTSTGRIDMTGVVALARSYDTVGPLAHSVEDCILLDMAMRGAVTTGVRRADPAGLSVVAPTNVVLDDADGDVLAAFERSLDALARAGVSVRREPVPVLDRVIAMNARHGTLTAAEAYVEHQAMIDGAEAELIDRRVVHRILGGKKMSAFDVLSIQRRRAEMMPALSAQLAGALLVMPTTPITAPEVAALESGDEAFHRLNLLALRNTMLGNVLGLCGIAMPNGRDRNAMPTSILFSAPHGEDDRLLGAALGVERLVVATAG